MRATALAGRVLTAVQVATAAVVVSRLLHGARRRRPAVTADQRPPAGGVTVVVPARNEENRIGPCLQALTADPAVTEIIVVDDQSDDRTAAVAASHGARVIRGDPLPPGWVGKPWALHQGLQQARTSWVVTLDADTRPRPGLVGGVVAAAVEEGLDLLSVTARYTTDSAIEQAVHASMLANLIYRFGRPHASRPARPARTVVNGQCLVFRRDALRAAGGFELAAGYLTDDIALARALANRGWRIGMVDAAALLSVDMHEGALDVWREWGRSLPMADVTTLSVALFDLATWGLTTVVPILRILTGRPSRTDVVLLAIRLALVPALRSTYSGSRLGLLVSPLVDPLVLIRLGYGVCRPARRWRGRRYPRQGTVEEEA